MMKFKSIQLRNRNPIARDYIEGKLEEFFPFSLAFSPESRLSELSSRNFPRESLASVLKEMNENWGAPDATIAQIERLRDERSVVVIGGQQAGLLTGPLYTIHKIVSIIKYAKEQEAKLNIPVIPVFWIAGEDHDYAEINHVYTTENGMLTKQTIAQQAWKRISISNLSLNPSLTEKWIKEVFSDLPETVYTRELVAMLSQLLEKSDTFVDFFARFIFELFESTGIVLIDSANPDLRKIESPYFLKMIDRQAEMTEAIYKTAQKLHLNGYPLQVEVSDEDGNLFYEDDEGERILLIRNGNQWIGKNEEVAFSTDELKRIAKEQPERLSNNVMTRPLMQEALFPTLAFVAGDGEISYWALLKQAFTTFDSEMTMPPVLPRLSITLITERINKLVKQRSLKIDEVINEGCNKAKMNWLQSQAHPPVQQMFKHLEIELKRMHEPIQSVAKSLGPDIANEAVKNIDILLDEIEYLKRRMLNRIEEQYEQPLSQFKEIELALRPRDGLQERILNIVPFINEYGKSIIPLLLELPLDFEKDHHLVYLK